jgi:hypothetical protein
MQFLNPLFALLSKLGLLIRIIILFGSFMLLRDGVRDFNFLSSYKQRKAFTVEELMAINPNDIPRYITVSQCLPTGQGVIQTATRRRSTTKTYIYPVLSLRQLLTESLDSTGATKSVAKVVLKKNFSGSEEEVTSDTLSIKTVEGLYDADGLDSDVRKLLEEDGYKIDAAPIVISESDTFPTYNKTYIYLGLGVLIAILLLGSFWWQFIGSKREEAANQPTGSEN